MALPRVPALARLIDHAVLRPTQTERDVVDACSIARRELIASVCITSLAALHVEARDLLHHTDTRRATRTLGRALEWLCNTSTVSGFAAA